MKILILFEKGFKINKSRISNLLKSGTIEISFNILETEFIIDDKLISHPESFKKALKNIKDVKSFDAILCFTEKQYTDNFFFYEYKNLTIFSLYGWKYLTNLPTSNGVVYFIVNYLALIIDPSGFRHFETTGCIYDFLADKRGVDGGMRQASLCSDCLERLTPRIRTKKQISIFEDLKTLMNELSNASRWNTDILNKIEDSISVLKKRKAKSGEAVNVVIASPGDTEIERKILIDTLERKFRVENHEKLCGKRLFVNGWEDLASQNGYAQDIINKKIIQSADFIVAVFKHKLGTPTKTSTGKKRAESGTSEELLQALDTKNKNHPIGMAYFFSTAPVISLDLPDKDKIETEWRRLGDFKKTIQDKMIYKPYTDPNHLLSIVIKDLEKNIIDYIE